MLAGDSQEELNPELMEFSVTGADYTLSDDQQVCWALRVHILTKKGPTYEFSTIFLLSLYLATSERPSPVLSFGL